MKPLQLAVAALAWTLAADAQVFRLTREQMIHYTPKNSFERFPDGRPRVPDAMLERLKQVRVSVAYEALRALGYRNQFADGFRVLHPGKKLVGRAFTAQYLPLRPDLEEVLQADAKKAGVPSSTNQKVIDLLQVNDVPVIDLIGAAPGHNFGGDNLQSAVWGATRTGAVVEGTVRDLEGLAELPSQIFFRQAHPAAVSGVSVVGINIPVNIGNAIVMPGDIVIGDDSGVLFIPPHLVEEVLKAK